MSRFNSYPLHDFTVSPLTSGFCDICIDESNRHRIKESAFFQRNFAIFSIYSSNKNRVLDYTIFNNKGEPLWNYKINASDLKY